MWEPVARKVLAQSQALTIDRESGDLVPDGTKGGMLLDMQSANVVISVLDALNPANREKMLRLKIDRAVLIAWGCLSPKN
jgi:hypothetical protein